MSSTANAKKIEEETAVRVVSASEITYEEAVELASQIGYMMVNTPSLSVHHGYLEEHGWIFVIVNPVGASMLLGMD